MRTSLLALILLAGSLAACDSTSPSLPVDIAGTWTFASTTSNSSLRRHVKRLEPW